MAGWRKTSTQSALASNQVKKKKKKKALVVHEPYISHHSPLDCLGKVGKCLSTFGMAI